MSLIEIVRAAYDEGYSDGVCAGTIFEDVNKGWNESQAQAALTAIMDAGDGVQQCDRDAAQEFWNPDDFRTPYKDDIPSGAADDLDIVQAFARHRVAAAAAERARIVAWLRTTCYGDPAEAKAFADMIEKGETE